MQYSERDVFKHTENWLNRYKDTKADLAKRREDIIHGKGTVSSRQGKGRKSDPTMARALSLASLEESKGARWVACIDRALGQMKEEYKTILFCRYVEKLPIAEIENMLYISRATFYSWRDKAVMLVAVCAAEAGLLKSAGGNNSPH